MRVSVLILVLAMGALVALSSVATARRIPIAVKDSNGGRPGTESYPRT